MYVIRTDVHPCANVRSRGLRLLPHRHPSKTMQESHMGDVPLFLGPISPLLSLNNALEDVDIRNNKLSGPLPDLSNHTNLRSLQPYLSF